MQHVQATAALEHHSWRYRGSPTTLDELPRNSQKESSKQRFHFWGGQVGGFCVAQNRDSPQSHYPIVGHLYKWPNIGKGMVT